MRSINSCIFFNFSGLIGYPQFRFDLEAEEDLKSEALIVKTISDAGYDFDPVELSEKFNYQITKKQPLDLKPNPLNKDKSNTNVDENGNLIDKLEGKDNATV